MGASHHESFEEQEARSRLLDQFLHKAKTNFPDGRLDNRDEGELAFAIATDPDSQVVRVHFGKPVAWFALPKKQALALAELLTQKANELK